MIETPFTKDHRWAPAQMSAYLDGELGARGRARMERHLAECEQCRRLLAGLRATVDLLRRWPRPREGVEPLALAASVRRRLEHPG